jgi:hypothetical protein
MQQGLEQCDHLETSEGHANYRQRPRKSIETFVY